MFDIKKYLSRILKKTGNTAATKKTQLEKAPVAVFDPHKAEPSKPHSCCGNCGNK